jgi:hypothetical protein
MREIARRFSVKDRTGKKKTIEMHPEPIFRYGGTARGWQDGTVWAFGKNGRPVLLLTLAAEDGEYDGETTSLSDTPIECSDTHGFSWQPGAPGLKMQAIPGVPRPSGQQRTRAFQLKQMARRFSAFEYWYTDDQSQGKQRFQLRLLPRPVWRYADPDAGIVDGAIFLYCYGTNPEVIGLIEAHAGKDGNVVWHAGFTRAAGADLFVYLGDDEFWEPPERDSRHAYQVFDVRYP